MIKTSFPAARIFTTSVIAIVTVVALTGLFLSGSPQAERMRRLDTQRISDLQQISYAIDNYWGSQQRLPNTLDELQATRDVYIQNIRDPKTGVMYEYQATSTESYQLCAHFETTSTESADTSSISITTPVPVRQDMQGRFWTHTSGRGCFSLTVRKPTPPPIK